MSSSVTDLKPVHLIYGSEQMRLQEALDRLRKRVAEVADLDFNFDQFDGENADMDAVVAACNTLPFASERRLVVVKAVDKVAKEGTDALVDYASNPSPTTILVLVAEKIAKNSRLYNAVNKLGGVAEYAAPKKSDYPREVARVVAARGRTITMDAAELLVASVGYDLRRLSAEIEKAIAYVGDRAELTREDVEAVTLTTAKPSIFEFTDALGDRDCARSLRLLSLLLDDESVYGLHAMSVRLVRDLIAARSLLDRGRGSSMDLASELKRPEWQMRRLAKQARGFTQDELVNLLRGAAETEAQMKTGRDPRLVFELWIVSACGSE